MPVPIPSQPAARLRVITWNVAHRVSRLSEQAAALGARRPTVVALQEVTRRTEPLWRRAFELLGLPHVCSSLPSGPGGARTGVLIASAAPLAGVPHALAVPRPESAVCVVVRSKAGAVELFCVHVPNAANGAVKPQTLRTIRAGIAAARPGPRILCGDLNTPRRELPTGEVVSFARDSRGRLRADRGVQWEEAELGVVPGLRDLGYRDVFRALHGYGAREPSWTWRQIAGHDGGWRLDHIFASAQLRPVACRYHHAWRDSGLSDHSGLEADLELYGGGNHCRANPCKAAVSA